MKCCEILFSQNGWLNFPNQTATKRRLEVTTVAIDDPKSIWLQWPARGSPACSHTRARSYMRLQLRQIFLIRDFLLYLLGHRLGYFSERLFLFTKLCFQLCLSRISQDLQRTSLTSIKKSWAMQSTSCQPHPLIMSYPVTSCRITRLRIK